MDSAASARALFIRKALEGRLAEVRSRLAAFAVAPPAGGVPSAMLGPPLGGGPLAVGSPPPLAPQDAEDALRAVMIRWWPRARSAGGEEEWRELLAALRHLEAPARSDDWRFLDAWNNVFEAMAAAPPPDALRSRAAAFLEAYAAILASHLERLAVSP